MMTNFRALVAGGFFSATPYDKSSGPVAERMNNPGAVNGAAWERVHPGFVSEIETTPGNRSTIFEAPEYGVAAWYELLCKYRAHGIVTVQDIINRYGGGQDYSGYIRVVCQRAGMSPQQQVILDGDDNVNLLAFAKAMFHVELGRPTKLSAEQIMFGIQFGYEWNNGKVIEWTPTGWRYVT